MNTHHTPELRAWLALAFTPSLNAYRLRLLLDIYSSPTEIQRSDRASLLAHGLSENSVHQLLNPDWMTVDRHIQWLEQSPQHHIVLLPDDGYPALLRQIDDPPLALFVRGQVNCLTNPQIAVVGSRSPSYAGRDNAFAFAQSLAEAGLTITSGLAMGIDGAGHRGAIAANAPTIAVFGTGIDTIYPPQHHDLAEAITELGALVSELPLGATPLRMQFPRRNRIVSGMSMGTLVVEATTRSGSLITARLAAEQGRDVFAIPGSIHSPTAQG
ncbi:MAG: DNA-processing protein DprA, partial [Pseudomonadota bacterium]|nr:DNA-processing protein DprA [Pseudomonadota bacterium]